MNAAASEDEAAGGSADYDFDGVFEDWQSSHGPQSSPSEGPRERSIQVEPRNDWRCLRCDSDSCSYCDELRDWICQSCGSHEFYQVNQPTKKITQAGTWMFVPHASSLAGPEKSRRRRRRKAKPGGTPSEPDYDGDEWAESEQRTDDPMVEPSDVGPSPGHLGGGKVRHPFSVSGSPQVPPQKSSPVKAARDQAPDRKTKEPNTKESSRSSAEASWNSRKGPEPGIRWKSGQMPPIPVWKYEASDMRAYAKFCKKIQIWQLQMQAYASKKDQALLLYNSLTGEPEQELEHLSIEDLYVDNGVQKILEMLKRPMEQRLVYQKRKFLHEFEILRRQSGETMRTYILRFRRVQRSLTAVGINIAGTYDNESLGARLLDRSGLSHSDQRMILVGTQQSLEFEQVAESLLLQYPEFRGAPPVVNKDGKGTGKGSGKSAASSNSTPASSSSSSKFSQPSGKGGYPPRKQALIANVDDTPVAEGDEELDPIEEADEDQEAVEDGPDDEVEQHDDAQDEEVDIQDLAQVLTVTARKLSGITLGRKFTTGNANKVKASPEELRKVTHCGACGALGHWHADSVCPHNQGNGSKPKTSGHKGHGGKASGKGGKGDKKNEQRPHQVSLVHHDHGSVRIEETPPEYGTLFTVNVVTMPPFIINEVKSFIDESSHVGMMVMDTACQRTCCGSTWYNSYVSLLDKFKMKTLEVDIHDVFQFGKGDPTVATKRAYLPCIVDDFPLLIGTAILPENVPLLGSNTLLKALGAVISFPDNMVHFQTIGKKVRI